MVPTRRGLFFIGVGVVTYLLAQQSNVDSLVKTRFEEVPAL